MANRCLVIGEAISGRLTALLEESRQVQSVRVAIHPYEVRGAIIEGVDVVFIRVCDWDQRLFAGIGKLKHYPEIVFISRPNDNYIEEIKSLVRFHIHEPFGPPLVDKVLQKIPEIPNGEGFDYLFIKYRRRYKKILPGNIVAIEKVLSQEIRIHTDKEIYPITSSLKKFLQQLSAKQFIQVAANLVIPITLQDLVNDSNFTYNKTNISLRMGRKKRHIQNRLSSMEELNQ